LDIPGYSSFYGYSWILKTYWRILEDIAGYCRIFQDIPGYSRIFKDVWGYALRGTLVTETGNKGFGRADSSRQWPPKAGTYLAPWGGEKILGDFYFYCLEKR
jgi:hypothetical protein